MSLPLSTCFILSKMFIIIVCAPKFKRILTNSISSESNYLENDNVNTGLGNFNTLRRDQNPPEKSENNCNGYDYDETKCKKVNDRIICGYNKNFGDLSNNERNIDLGNGCRMRGDRIECGYVIGPFTNPRRPPAHPDHRESKIKPSKRTSTNGIIHLNLKRTLTTVVPAKPPVIITTKATTPTTKPTTIMTIRPTRTTKLTTLLTTRPTTQLTTMTPMNLPNTTLLQTTVNRDSTTKSVEKSKNKSKSRCVEKNDRIVCYPV